MAKMDFRRSIPTTLPELHDHALNLDARLQAQLPVVQGIPPQAAVLMAAVLLMAAGFNDTRSHRQGSVW